MMTEIISFIIGGIFTLAVFTAGAIFGHLTASKKLEEKAQDIQHKLTPPPQSSGGVKAITPEEVINERKKGFIGKMQDIIS